MTPRPCCLTSAFLPLAWPDRGHSRPPTGPRSQPLQMGVKWDQGGGTSVGCSLCGAQDSRQAAQNEGGNDQSCGNEAGAVEAGRLGGAAHGETEGRSPLPRAEASLRVEEAPEVRGRRRSEASSFTCPQPRLRKVCEVGPHVVMEKGGLGIAQGWGL